MGKIITFYSYKGGVGRSMLLANVATLLCKWKYHVLIIDWDLEAPGIEQFFKNQFENEIAFKQARSKKGVIDILSSKSNSTRNIDFKDVITKVSFATGEYLDLIISGKKDESYAKNVREFSVDSFYDKYEGGFWLEQQREELKKAYDFILIDSRTGVTDFGGICTIHLPDILLMVLAATEQNIEGTVDIAERVIKSRQTLPIQRPVLQILPIVSRFDVSASADITSHWKQQYALRLSHLYDEILPKEKLNEKDKIEFIELTKIPYHPDYSFGEKLPVLDGTTDPTSVGYAFENISALLADELNNIGNFIKNRDSYVQNFTKGNSRPIHLPYQSMGSLFMGRDNILKELHQSFKTSSGEKTAATITCRALYGLGGVGKTRLAVEYAWKYSNDYIAVLSVSAESQEDLQRNFAALTGPLNLNERFAKEEEIKVHAVLEWLQMHPGWLMILDSCDKNDVKKNVEELLSQLHGGHVLITTRQSNWSKQIRTFSLDVLSAEHATAFLLERTDERRRKEPEEYQTASKIVNVLGGLALALEQAGAYIEHRRLSFSAYLALWKENHSKVIEWYDPITMQYPKSVAATLLTSFNQLSAQGKELLNMLAWLSPEQIPEHIFETIDDIRLKDNFFEALAELEAYSLINRDTHYASFNVHRLVQDVARRNNREGDARSSVEILIKIINVIFNIDPTDVRNWNVLLPLLPHSLALIDAAQILNIDREATGLMNQTAMLLITMSRYKEAEPLLRKALLIEEEVLDRDDHNIALRLNNLAQLLKDTNRMQEAEPLMRRVLQLDESRFGKSHPNVARDLNNLAQLLFETSRTHEAEPLMRRALFIDEQNLGENHPIVAIRLNNLALILKATNRSEEAEPLMRRALLIDEQNWGENHPNVARGLNNLAQLLHDTKRIAEAEPLMRRALLIDEQNFGDNHPSVAIRLGNLAQLLQDTNRKEEAEPLIRRALMIDEQSWGANHPNVAIRLNNLAQLLADTNRLEEAEPLMKRALQIDEQSWGENHPSVARNLNNLAQLFASTNRVHEAEPLMRRSVMILNQFQEQSGHEHPSFNTVANNYMGVLIEMGQTEEEAIAITKNILGIE